MLGTRSRSPMARTVPTSTAVISRALPRPQTVRSGLFPDMVKAAALQKAATFDEFNEDNDPYGEHDFGSFDLCGRKFFWKIEYYDRTMEYGSEDPSDPAKTTRVMTVMLASEY